LKRHPLNFFRDIAESPAQIIVAPAMVAPEIVTPAKFFNLVGIEKIIWESPNKKIFYE